MLRLAGFVSGGGPREIGQTQALDTGILGNELVKDV
eukprot:COSAG02_NODE_222_length_28382_cov_82.417601_11_plen_36_part_00